MKNETRTTNAPAPNYRVYYRRLVKGVIKRYFDNLYATDGLDAAEQMKGWAKELRYGEIWIDRVDAIH
jgi:hypothetical protein